MKELQRFVDMCLAQQGCHYIWGGKGYKKFHDGKLVDHGIKDAQDKDLLVFDCSGLVTFAVWQLTNGKVDLRGSHSAKTIFDTFPFWDQGGVEGGIICYPEHVAVALAGEYVVDANRGGSKTVTILDAMRAGARVEVHRTVRPANTILGYRRIPLDKSELRRIHT